MATYNIYCDESCHLPRDSSKVMLLGAVWCSADQAREIGVRVREIKERHNLPRDFEVKWTKVSPGKQQFYIDLVDYFFDNTDLHFRGLIIPNKDILDHDRFGQDHDTWYFKMYFTLLKVVFRKDDRYRIYLDIKDTCSASKVAQLHEVLCNNAYDFKREIIERVQTVRSHEVEQLQLTDLILGAVGYANRTLSCLLASDAPGEYVSPAKAAIVERIRKRSGYSLTRSTLIMESKFNLLRWQGQE